MKKLVAKQLVTQTLAAELPPQLNTADKDSLPNKVLDTLYDNCKYLKQVKVSSPKWTVNTERDFVSVFINKEYDWFEFALDIGVGFDAKKSKYMYEFELAIEFAEDDYVDRFLRILINKKPKLMELDEDGIMLSFHTDGDLGSEELVLTAARNFAKAIADDLTNCFDRKLIKQGIEVYTEIGKALQ